jgi:hypothetical protein
MPSSHKHRPDRIGGLRKGRKPAGRRSLTEHLAKVRIAGSSPVARSSKSRSKCERQRRVTGSIPVSPPQRRNNACRGQDHGVSGVACGSDPGRGSLQQVLSGQTAPQGIHPAAPHGHSTNQSSLESTTRQQGAVPGPRKSSRISTSTIVGESAATSWGTNFLTAPLSSLLPRVRAVMCAISSRRPRTSSVSRASLSASTGVNWALVWSDGVVTFPSFRVLGDRHSGRDDTPPGTRLHRETVAPAVN